MKNNKQNEVERYLLLVLAFAVIIWNALLQLDIIKL
jgi:hypothetical protein